MPKAKTSARPVALVTGSTGEGMGRQTALTLAGTGFDVVVNYGTYRGSRTAAERMVAQLEGMGVRALAVKADTRKEEDVKRLVEETVSAFGRIDALIVNSGGDFIVRPLERLSLAQWRRVVEAELDGAFLLARFGLRHLRKRAGRLVFISWDGAERAYKPPYDYAVGKMARDALAAKLARAEEASGVTVNTVAPGAIPYPSTTVSKALVKKGSAWTQRKRSTTQDVADAVAWLVSQEARFVTGSTIRVYGPPF
jgi:3-oxoacyl-[acyl-carrier protein] reductase